MPTASEKAKAKLEAVINHPDRHTPHCRLGKNTTTYPNVDSFPQIHHTWPPLGIQWAPTTRTPGSVARARLVKPPTTVLSERW